MDITEITLYQPIWEHTCPYVKKKTFKLDKKDKVEFKDDGFIGITLVDEYQNGHNGDWEDEHEYGYTTFEQAKRSLLKHAKEEAQKKIKYIKLLKENIRENIFL